MVTDLWEGTTTKPLSLSKNITSKLGQSIMTTFHRVNFGGVSMK